jgi:SAM-dependent methyltransferase
MTADFAIPRYIEVERIVGAIDAKLKKRDPIMPDEKLVSRVSPASTLNAFRALSLDSFRVLLHLTNLASDSRVLDVGCGLGRVAMPLTRYLVDGTYDGVDIMADVVEDSRNRISTRFPNFRFHHVDVYSGRYNKNANAQAQKLSFDFPDEEFDVVFLFSVFSHMFPDDVRAYLKEFHRLLRPGGMVLATFFLLTERAEARIRAGEGRFSFAHSYGSVRVNDAQIPESAVAYSPALVDELIDESGLTKLFVSYGSWTGVSRSLTGQDAVICQKSL